MSDTRAQPWLSGIFPLGSDTKVANGNVAHERLPNETQNANVASFRN